MPENESESALSVLKNQATHLSNELAKMTSDRDKHQAARTALDAKLAALETATSGHAKNAARVTELEGELRTVRHHGAFAKAAKAAGVREDAIDDLFTLSGYKAEKDVVDPTAFDTILTTAREARAYAFNPEAEETTETDTAQTDSAAHAVTDKPVLRAVPAPGRGGTVKAKEQGAIITAAQMADPKFALNPANRERIAEAAKNHRLRGYPDREATG